MLKTLRGRQIRLFDWNRAHLFMGLRMLREQRTRDCFNVDRQHVRTLTRPMGLKPFIASLIRLNTPN